MKIKWRSSPIELQSWQTCKLKAHVGKTLAKSHREVTQDAAVSHVLAECGPRYIFYSLLP